jgi:transcriptional regulator with XRE-family HTH domain
MDVAQRLGQNLRRLRAEAGQTQEQLAAKAAVHRTVVSQLETGDREPRATTILKLAGALGVEPGDLFHGMSWTPPEQNTGSFDFD